MMKVHKCSDTETKPEEEKRSSIHVINGTSLNSSEQICSIAQITSEINKLKIDETTDDKENSMLQGKKLPVKVVASNSNPFSFDNPSKTAHASPVRQFVRLFDSALNEVKAFNRLKDIGMSGIKITIQNNSSEKHADNKFPQVSVAKKNPVKTESPQLSVPLPLAKEILCQKSFDVTVENILSPSQFMFRFAHKELEMMLVDLK